MNKFKFRAECKSDYNSFLELIDKSEIVEENIIPDYGGLPDIEVLMTLKTISLDELRDILRKVEDGHVMVQTVALEKDYTGKRNYDL